MAAFEIRNPIIVLIRMKADDLSFHGGY